MNIIFRFCIFVNMEIGTKIKKVRELKNFTQGHMAELLGVSQSSYSRYESPDSDLSISQLNEIANIFDMKAEDILAFDEKYVLNNYGEIKGHQLANIYNSFPEKLEKLYEDKIQLLEDKIKYLEGK